MPRVSVLLTSYNHIDHLPLGLESIRSQGFSDYEIIAVDDGSTDGSREFLREQTGLKLIETESNSGTYAALNQAVAAASGEFVAIFNDDDLWAPEKLSQQVEALDQNPKAALCSTGGQFIDSDGHELQGTPLGFAFPSHRTGDILLDLVRANCMITSSVMIRREELVKVGGFEESLFGSADWLTWLALCENNEAAFVDAPLTSYRVHAGSASLNRDKVWQDDEKIRTWISTRIPLWLEKGYSEQELRSAEAHNWAALGTAKTLNGKKAEGRECYAKALSLEPTLKRKIWKAASALPKSLFKRLVLKRL
jgi:glycosyltransferase involved in cell wall biosynthesis